MCHKPTRRLWPRWFSFWMKATIQFFLWCLNQNKMLILMPSFPSRMSVASTHLFIPERDIARFVKNNDRCIFVDIIGLTTAKHRSPATQMSWTRTILCMRPASGRRRYNITSSLIGWAHTQNDPCLSTSSEPETHFTKCLCVHDSDSITILTIQWNYNFAHVAVLNCNLISSPSFI